MLPCPAAPYEFLYNSVSQQSSYILNTSPMTQVAAEQFCRDNGMHLVTWASRAEQNEVRGGGLLGGFQGLLAALQPTCLLSSTLALHLLAVIWNTLTGRCCTSSTACFHSHLSSQHLITSQSSH